MNREEFYRALENTLEVEDGSISGELKLAEIRTWDSLAILSTIALIDAKYSIAVTAGQIGNCEKVDDLFAVVAEKIVA